MNRRARLVAFVAFVALVAGVSLAGCVSSGSVETEPVVATDAATSETDPASAMRIALDDLVGQMTPPSEDVERNIGVTPPEGETTVATYLQDEIIAAFLRARIPGLAVYERTHINTLLQEANLGISGLISEESAMEVGNMVGVDAMVVGATRTIADQTVLNTRVVDVETGRIIGAGSVSIPTALLGGADRPASPSTILERRFEVIDLVLKPEIQPPPEMRVHRITTYDGTWTEYNAEDTMTAQGAIRNVSDDRFEIHWSIPEGFGVAVFNYHRTADSIVARIVVDDHEIGYIEFAEL